MRFTPYDEEYAAVPELRGAELLDYFLLRAFETEEVWSLREGKDWMIRDASEHRVMSLWPYKRYASDAALDIWQSGRPDAVALEYFLEDIIPELIADNILFDVMPRNGETGFLISPQKLASIFEGMMDAGEYRLDG
ncbi:MAG: hypothetical protein CMI09_11035 [Oceanospirillaceae bacterium]|nr:hypothetical protein [Oceanospirillaceae bacterium]|tara:strand:- start:24 stop:431 length:408 start_codon:yes stop_codon:yes gene_type:complete